LTLSSAYRRSGLIRRPGSHEAVAPTAVDPKNCCCLKSNSPTSNSPPLRPRRNTPLLNYRNRLSIANSGMAPRHGKYVTVAMHDRQCGLRFGIRHKGAFVSGTSGMVQKPPISLRYPKAARRRSWSMHYPRRA
jgi:hypothetical protein